MEPVIIEPTTNTTAIVNAGDNFRNLYARFVAYVDASPKTVATYKQNLKPFISYLQERGITAPTRDTVRAYRDHLQADGKKFGETVVFMVSALTGKTARELRTSAVPPETPQDEAKAGGQGEGSEVKKKSFLCRIFSRSRRSS